MGICIDIHKKPKKAHYMLHLLIGPNNRLSSGDEKPYTSPLLSLSGVEISRRDYRAIRIFSLIYLHRPVKKNLIFRKMSEKAKRVRTNFNGFHHPVIDFWRREVGGISSRNFSNRFSGSEVLFQSLIPQSVSLFESLQFQKFRGSFSIE